MTRDLQKLTITPNTAQIKSRDFSIIELIIHILGVFLSAQNMRRHGFMKIQKHLELVTSSHSVTSYNNSWTRFLLSSLIATHFLIESKLLVIASQINEIQKIFGCCWFQCRLWRLSMVQCGHFFLKIFVVSSHFISIFTFTIWNRDTFRSSSTQIFLSLLWTVWYLIFFIVHWSLIRSYAH